MNRRGALRALGIALALAVSHAWAGVVPHVRVGSIGGSAGATFNYYISPTGSDSNTGTSISQPWAITSLYLHSSHQSVIAGQRIGLLPGTYTVTGVTVTEYEDNVLTLPFGSSGSPTYIGCSDSSGHYSPRTCTIDWVDTSGGIGGLDAGFIGTPNIGSGTPGYVTIDGLIIDGGNTTGGHLVQVFSTIGQTGGYQNGGATYPVGIIVENCEIRNIQATDNGNNDAGVFFNGTNGAIVTNNYIHDIVKTGQTDHAHAIEEYGSQGNQFTYNTVARATGGIESKGGSSGTNVAYNYITASQYAAIMGFDGCCGNPNTPSTAYAIHNNVLDGNIAISFAAFIGDQNVGAGLGITQETDYYNNTIYDQRASNIQEIWFAMHGTANLNSLYNNLFDTPSNTGTSGGGAIVKGMWGVASYNGSIAGPPISGTLLDYNCYVFHAFGIGLNSATSTTLSAWKSASGIDANSLAPASPGFVGSITSGNGPAQFQLSNTSSCFGTGQGGVNMGAWDGTVTQIGASWAPATP